MAAAVAAADVASSLPSSTASALRLDRRGGILYPVDCFVLMDWLFLDLDIFSCVDVF